MKILIVSIFLFIFKSTFAQPSLSAIKTDSIITAIAELQTKRTVFYKAGQFPSQRGRYRRVEDNGIFFNSLIAFTLQERKEQLSSHYRQMVDSIVELTTSNYPLYKNKSGIQTYNFWKTNPPHFFPNSLLSRFSSFQIPDDADCTVLIYLTDTSLATHTLWLQDKLTQHANKSKLKIKNTFRPYREFKAYSTWFGKKMPVEFDLCVQTNILYFIYKNQLPLTIQAQESLLLLRKQIQSGDYLKYAYYLSPSYKKRSIVLYHLARLLEYNNIKELEDCRETVKNDIEAELKKEKTFMDKVILSTALIRMKGQPQPIRYPADLNKSLINYVFFRANLFSSYARPSLRFITKNHFFDVPFYCKAYSLALLAEYEILTSSKR